MRLKCNLFKIKAFTFVLILVFGISGQISAQQRTIEGTVTDNQGLPLPGVTVVVKGTTQGTVTNADGNYSLSNIPDDATLVFSFVGMRTTEIEVKNQTSVNVTLEQETIGIEEVVAIGYGTIKKSDLTGSVQTLNGEQHSTRQMTNVIEMLSGTIAGLASNQGTSASGGGSMEIRGPNSLKASTNPLIVLDGVIFNGNMADINPSDVESINVLKDASAAAVFGSRSASGVLIINTKKGKQVKPSINFSAKLGVSEFTNNMKPFDPEGYINLRKAYLTRTYTNRPENYYTNPNELPSDLSVEEWLNFDISPSNDPVDVWLNRLVFTSMEAENYKAGRTTDWFDEIMQQGFQQDYSLSLNGGNENIRYYWSVGATNNKGKIKGDNYKTIRSRVNIDADINEFLKVGLNAHFSDIDQGYTEANIDAAVNASPYGQMYNEDGSMNWYPHGDTNTNPLMSYIYRDKLDKTQSLFANLFGELSIPLGFSYKLSYVNRFNWRKDYWFDPLETLRGYRDNGYGVNSNNSLYEWMIDNLIKWDKTIFEIHKFDFTFLYNLEKYQSWSSTMTNSNFEPSTALSYHALQAGANPSISNNNQYRTANALMARLNYVLMNKYLVTLTWRRDGSSVFGINNPYASFPSAALGWTISEEDFFNIPNVNYLKIRGSWGKVGNSSIGMYSALAQLGTSKYLYGTTLTSGVYSNTMANYDLRWETTESLNFGLDFGFSNRINGNLELYKMDTENLLLDRSLPQIVGYRNVADNLGKLTNRGFELSLNSSNIQSLDFKWNTNLIFSFNRNKIHHLYGDMIDILDENGTVIGQKEADDPTNGWFIGESIDRIWDYKVLGVYQLGEEEEAAVYGKAPGDIKLFDVNDDGKLIPEDDKVFQGYKKPQYRIGLRNDIIFLKNFEFSAFIRADLGFFRSNSLHKNNSPMFHRMNFLERPFWTPDNPNNEYARLDAIVVPEYNYWENSSFLRLQDVSISYIFPSDKIEKLNLKNLRVYISLHNYITLTKWNHWDPESGTSPMPKSASFGINIGL